MIIEIMNTSDQGIFLLKKNKEKNKEKVESEYPPQHTHTHTHPCQIYTGASLWTEYMRVLLIHTLTLTLDPICAYEGRLGSPSSQSIVFFVLPCGHIISQICPRTEVEQCNVAVLSFSWCSRKSSQSIFFGLVGTINFSCEIELPSHTRSSLMFERSSGV